MTTLKKNLTGANRGNREGNQAQNLCSLRSLLLNSGGRGVVEIDFNLANSEGVNIYSRRDGDTDFKFLARDTSPTYVDNPESFRDKPELREYIPTRRDAVGDVEVSQFSDEITFNCAPLV